MATSNNNKELNGKIGKTVTYLLNGQWVTRTIGLNTKAPTILQLAARQMVGLITVLLRPVKGFIKVGFALEIKNTFLTANNKATSENLLHALTGEYPDQRVDYSKAIFSKGTMQLNKEFDVSLTETGLLVRWDPDYLLKSMLPSDRVMVIAYCPEKKYAFYETDGAKRKKGRFHLPLVKYHQRVVLHTYVAFIAANQKTISNTTYTGEFLW